MTVGRQAMPRRSRFGVGSVSLAGVVGLAAASACGGTMPQAGTSALFTTPSAATPVSGLGRAGEPSRMLAREVVTYTLANGTFTFTTARGELTGTYTGFVTEPSSGRPTATLTLTVTGGTNAFAGATGTLTGDGKGEFLAGGRFAFSLEGVVRTSAVPAGSTFHTTVVGTATLAEPCSANNRIISRLRGEGIIAPLGRARVELESEIVETVCFED